MLRRVASTRTPGTSSSAPPTPRGSRRVGRDHGDGSPPPDWRVGQAAAPPTNRPSTASGRPPILPSPCDRAISWRSRSWRGAAPRMGGHRHRLHRPGMPSRRGAGRPRCARRPPGRVDLRTRLASMLRAHGSGGYSGGAQATLSAAEQQPGYAPESTSWGSPWEASPWTREYVRRLRGSLRRKHAERSPSARSSASAVRFPDVELLGSLTPDGRAIWLPRRT